MAWQEEYEKCLDVLTDFIAQFGRGNPRAEDIRQWLLRWLDEHSEYGLSYVREQLRTAPEQFFTQQERLVAVLFVFVQACRNAYLNCACFGCDEEARLPLARVWLLPEDRATGQVCRIVTIDAYPPYRRPIQPDCWPAPLGSVNVGRFVWHRWEEVCSALHGLGLDVERETFELPGTVADLKEALDCDLFVPCDERRVALVFDAEIPGFNVDIFGDRVIGFCQTAPGLEPGPEPGPCPDIRVEAATQANSGEVVRFTAVLNPPVPDLSYNWTSSHGTITSGQGTSGITVDVGDMIGPLTATVVIKGLAEECNDTASGTTRIINPQFNAQPGGAGEADFTQIDQIGAGRAKTLHEAGIRTFRELANTPIERMRELFPPPVKEDQLREWLQAAKQLAG